MTIKQSQITIPKWFTHVGTKFLNSIQDSEYYKTLYLSTV